MNFKDSILFATVMTLLDEVKDQEQKSTFTEVKPIENSIDIKFNFENLKAKDKLVALVERLCDKGNVRTEEKKMMLVSSLITVIIYESVKSAAADSDTKNRVYDYAINYCNVQSDISWEVLNENDGDQLADEDDQLLNILKRLSDQALDMIFIISTHCSGEEIITEFIRLLTELMIHLEDDVKSCFPIIKFENRFPVVALDFIMSGMKREMQRLEEADPSLKENAKTSVATEKITEFRNNARDALKLEDTNKAATYYKLIENLDQNDWEAVFYRDFCLAFDTPERINTERIQSDTIHIAGAMIQAMPLAKKQVLIRTELLVELSNVCAWLSKISANYFVATMNEFKNSSKGIAAKSRKSNQVYWIMQMLFTCGDAIEENFGSDKELCENLCVVCWKFAFECYENCDMFAPSGLYDYYQKILKYEPSFRCSKELTGSYTGNSSGGCYVATAIYGSYDCPQVWTLRRYRDFSLKHRVGGKLFIRVYYAVSPPLIKIFGKTKLFNIGCKKMLDKFVAKLQADGYKDTPYKD